MLLSVDLTSFPDLNSTVVKISPQNAVAYICDQIKLYYAVNPGHFSNRKYIQSIPWLYKYIKFEFISCDANLIDKPFVTINVIYTVRFCINKTLADFRWVVHVIYNIIRGPLGYA